jgi:hypothetical protein
MIYIMLIHIEYIPINIHIYSVLYFRINCENIAQLFTDGYKITAPKFV